MKREDAYKFIEALKALREDATDKIASLAVMAYPTLKQSNALIKVGTRINWNGKLLRATNDIWDTEENNPDNAPALWEEINYKEGYRIIPETITVGTAFAKDEKGWWGDILYVSLLDANVYTPEQYPSGWQLA